MGTAHNIAESMVIFCDSVDIMPAKSKAMTCSTTTVVDIKPELKQCSLSMCASGEFNVSTLFCDECAKAKYSEITPTAVCGSCNHLEYMAFMAEKIRKSEAMRKKSEKEYMETKRKLRIKKLLQSR